MMKFIKYAASLLFAAAISVCGMTAAYAEAPNDGLPDTVVQGPAGENDPNDPDNPGVPGDPEEKDPQETHRPEGVDTSNKPFEEIDLTDFVLWDGETEFEENTNYYIEETVKIGKDKLFTLPKSSRLVMCGGSQLLIYVGGQFRVGGTFTVAPEATLISSGTFSVLKEGGFENYGSTAFTTSSTVNISSTFVSKTGSDLTFSGMVYLYKDGEFVNYGKTIVSKNSETFVTGVWQAPEGGQLFIKGKMTVTLSGKFDAASYVSLTGELLNSGMVVFEENVKYYKTKEASLAVTKSGRIIDYRKRSSDSSENNFKTGVKGIDVSSWQGVIDWQKVAKSGVKFAIIRSSVGDEKQDKMFEYNITEAKKAGIWVGVYHYCYALTPEEARIEAQNFIKTIEPYKIDYPVMFDFEDPSQVNLGKEKLTEIAQVFLKELKDAGYYPMIYSYRIWLEENLDMSALSEYEVAVAEWGVPASTYKGKFGIWQYSCKGIVSGIEGDVDLDICYKDYATIIKNGGYNNPK